MRKVFPILLCVSIINDVSGYVRLQSPPARSSLWRYGYEIPPNYDDVSLNCGGFEQQWEKNDGKCGICGDPFDMPKPRKYETGGVFNWNNTTRRYLAGEVIDAVAHLTTNMLGFLEFRICPMSDPDVEVTQECLDQGILNLAYEPGSRFPVSKEVNGIGIGDVAIPLRLPKDVTCSHCVFQMTYTAGNRWSRCDNGTEALGCLPEQVTFKNCADISISANPSNTTSNPSSDFVLIPLDTDVQYEKLPEKSIEILLKLSKEGLAMMKEDSFIDKGRVDQDVPIYEEYANIVVNREYYSEE